MKILSEIIKFIFYYSTNIEKKKFLVIFFLNIINTIVQFMFVIYLYNIIQFLIGINTEPNKFIKFELYDPKNLNIYELSLYAAIILIIYTFIQIVYYYLSYKWVTNFVSNIEKKIYQNSLNLNYSFFKSTKSYDYIKNIIDHVPRLTLGTIFPLFAISSSLTMIFIFLFFLLKVNFFFTLVSVLILFTIFLVTFLLIKKKLFTISQNENFFLSKRIKYINYLLIFFREIKIFELKSYFNLKFNTYTQGYFNSRFLSYFFSSFPKNIFEFLIFFFLLFFIIFISVNSDDKTYYTPLLILYTLAAYKLIPSFVSLLSSISTIKANYNFFLIIKKDLERFNKTTSKNNIVKVDSYNGSLIDSLSIKNLNFAYSKPLIRNFNIEIKKSDTIFLYGESGTGKSTLLDIICGLIQPNSGDIYVNNSYKITEYNSSVLLKKISYVSQFPDVLEQSIYQNITLNFDSNNKNDEKFDKIISIVAVDEILKSKNITCDTVLEEKGLNLSGGEKQRINIARSLYKDFDLLIMDEATNSLDLDTEKKILKNIINFAKNKILIFSSHNIELKKYFNKSIFLEKL
jgi:HlyD family secretion protein